MSLTQPSNSHFRQLVRCSYGWPPCCLLAFPEVTWGPQLFQEATLTFPLTMMALSGTNTAWHVLYVH